MLRLVPQVFFGTAITVLVVASVASATTVGTNISTNGNLSVGGNVGIGTTTPSGILDVYKDYGSGSNLQLTVGASSTDHGYAHIVQNDPTNLISHSALRVESNGWGVARFTHNASGVDNGAIVGANEYSTSSTGMLYKAYSEGLGSVFKGESIGITDGNLIDLVQREGDFSGSGINMNFADGSGTFTGNFLNFSINSESKFKVDSAGRIMIGQASVPATTTDTLYNVAGNLYWNGGTVSKKTYTLTPADANDVGGSTSTAYVIGSNDEDILIVDGTNLSDRVFLILNDSTPAKQIDVKPHDADHTTGFGDVLIGLEFTDGSWTGEKYDLGDWSETEKGISVAGAGGKSIQLVGVTDSLGRNRWSSPSSGMSVQNNIAWQGGRDVDTGYENRYSLNSIQYAALTNLDGVKMAWDVNGSNIYYNTGYVGIGTTSPAYKLDVVIDADDDIVRFGGISSGMKFQSKSNSIDLIGLNSDDTGPTDIVIRGAGHQNTGLRVQGATGNVGITSAATTTVTIDSNADDKGSCMKYKDSDGVGYTYCTFNDGVPSCSTTSCE